jgi:ATP-binding cassette subfamily B protein
MVQNSITLVSIAIILIPYGLWIPLVLFLSTLPALFITVRYDRLYLDWWKQTTASRRWAQYYDMVLTHASIAAEVRLFGLGKYFKTNYQQLRERLRTERLNISRRQGLAQLGGGLLAGLMTLITLLWMLWQTVQGLFTLGDLALFYQAFDRGQRLMRSLLGNLGQIYSNTLFLGNLFEFLDLEPDVSDPEKPVPAPVFLKEGICFRGVSFSYPGSERLVLQDFDFEIPAGKVVAIVGANGAGKTTLGKLICRFYDPEDGQIELDGCNIRNFAVADLRRQLTVMFQFPVTYVANAAENIAYGDLSMKLDSDQVELAARRAGSHEVISRLPEGYKTMLGKWFDKGTELSGGEWQRIALARAFYRQAPIMILDEPTSQMDSWTEIDWFDRFRDLTQGRTALIITHRFTTAKRADVIHVMDQGKIIESGSHEELLIRDGLYAQSWQAQMRESVSQTDPMLEY